MAASDHSFQPAILFLELFKLADLIRFQPLVLFLSPIQRLLRDPHLPDQLRYRDSRFGLLKYRHDLLDGKSFPLHSQNPPSSDFAGNSLSACISFWGAGQS